MLKNVALEGVYLFEMVGHVDSALVSSCRSSTGQPVLTVILSFLVQLRIMTYTVNEETDIGNKETEAKIENST